MSIGFNMNIGFQTGSPDMVAYQQRMMMRQNQLGQCYMPITQPSMDQIMGLQGFYNGCLGNIQQLRCGMPYGQGLFEGLPSANTMAYLDPQVMQYLQMQRQKTSMTIMMCLMYEQQYQMQQSMLRMMMMGQQNQMNSDVLNQLFQMQQMQQQQMQQQQMQQQQYQNPQATQYPQYQNPQIQQTQQPVDTGAARSEAVALHSAMEGLGTDETSLSSLLANKTNEQIKAIKQEYQNLYGVSLEHDINGDTSGNYREALNRLCQGNRSTAAPDQSEARADATALHQAMKGCGTDESVLTNMLCSRNKEQIDAIKRAYQDMYGKDLMQDVHNETHGLFENNAYGDLLDQLLRNSPSGTSAGQAAGQAQVPGVKPGVTPYFTPAAPVVSPGTAPGVSPGTAPGVSPGTPYDVKTGLKNPNPANTPVQTGQVRPQVDRGASRADAVALRNAMEGLGTDEKTLSTIMSSRSNAEMQAIREEYQNLYGVSLEENVKGDTSGNYQKALLKLMSGSRSSAPASQGEARADAAALRQAMQGMGTNEDVLTNILCSRNREQLEAVKKEYQQMYGRDLSKDVSGETHGMFENNAYGDLLGSVLNNSPSGNPAVK
ncbi:MAG: annexin [Candidatus Xenobiia bacterium LiM19]